MFQSSGGCSGCAAASARAAAEAALASTWASVVRAVEEAWRRGVAVAALLRRQRLDRDGLVEVERARVTLGLRWELHRVGSLCEVEKGDAIMVEYGLAAQRRMMGWMPHVRTTAGRSMVVVVGVSMMGEKVGLIESKGRRGKRRRGKNEWRVLKSCRLL